MDRAQQILGGAALEQEAAGAGAQRADEVLVVDQHHADRAVRFGHGALGPWGSVARTSKRSPTRRASSVPPSSAARPRIPVRPWPPVVRAVAAAATGLATVSV